MHRVTKHYGHELGLSACFRQHRALSHCSFLHGYALAFTFVFEAKELDTRGWVIDFGDLNKLKDWLEFTFDHKTLVAQDDPRIEELTMLAGIDVADVIVLPRVGCEAFAKLAFEQAYAILVSKQLHERVNLVSCTVHEHGANSATYTGEN